MYKKTYQRETRRRKLLMIFVVFTILAGAGGYVYSVTDNRASESLADRSEVATTEPVSELTESVNQPKKTSRIIASGDTIAHGSVNENANTATGRDYFQFMDQMKPVFDNADVRFCNQSTLIGGEQFPISGYPDFNAPAELAEDLVKAGCNVINTASNHSSDKSQAVIDANVDIWAAQQNVLAVAGQNKSLAGQDAIEYFAVDGINYAFLAYTTYSNKPPETSYGVNIYSREFAASQIASAKSGGADIIITSMRWGTEYSDDVNALQASEAQYLADMGVDIVFGHGPHVLGPVQRLTGDNGNETIVWHSLGNFLNTQLDADTLFSAVAVMDVDIATKKIVSIGYLPVYMHYDWTGEQRSNNDLFARTNLELVPLETAGQLFTRSLLDTTLTEQKTRINSVLNTFAKVDELSLSDF